MDLFEEIKHGVQRNTHEQLSQKNLHENIFLRPQ